MTRRHPAPHSAAASAAKHPAARARRWLLCAVAMLPCGGCAYLRARYDDFNDCFLYRWHQDALGVAVEAKVGPLAGSVGGWYADWGYGKDTWWQQPGYVLTNHGTGIPFTTLGPVAYSDSWSRVFATGASGNHPAAPDAYDDVTSWLFLSDVFDLDDNLPFRLSPQQRVSDAFGVEVGVVPLFVGLRIGFNVAEFADLLLGFVGIDVFGDDGHTRPPTLPMIPAPSSGSLRQH